MNSRDKLLIIGASGHGKVVADIALKMHCWHQVLFADDNEAMKTSMGIPVITGVDIAFTHLDEYDIFVAIGNNEIRENIQTQLETAGAHIPVLIHPSAIIGEQVELGNGTVIMARAVINCCTRIGKGVIINTGSTVDHDNLIEDYVHISPGTHTAGTVKIGKGTWMGIGSIVSNNLSIAGKCQVGAGAVVIRDINEAGTYVGVPARRI